MEESKRITIKIAGQKAFDLDIPAGQESHVHDVEKNVNKIWAKWCDKFQNKSPQDILAMVTFQYARFYYDLLDKTRAHEQAIRDFERDLDNILLDVE